MELFSSRISKGTVAEAAKMIDAYYASRGLKADEFRLNVQTANEMGWWLKEGSADLYIVIQESDNDGGAVLRISSPLVFAPQHNREIFYRRLLDINCNLTGCALATHDNIVLVIAQRHTLGLVQEELDELVWNTAFVADLLDDKLAKEFNVPLHSQAQGFSMAGQKAT